MSASGWVLKVGVSRVIVVKSVLGVEELKRSWDCRKAGDVDGEVGE